MSDMNVLYSDFWKGQIGESETLFAEPSLILLTVIARPSINSNMTYYHETQMLYSMPSADGDKVKTQSRPVAEKEQPQCPPHRRFGG